MDRKVDVPISPNSSVIINICLALVQWVTGSDWTPVLDFSFFGPGLEPTVCGPWIPSSGVVFSLTFSLIYFFQSYLFIFNIPV